MVIVMAGSLLNFDVPELLSGKNYINCGNLQAARRTDRPFSLYRPDCINI